MTKQIKCYEVVYECPECDKPYVYVVPRKGFKAMKFCPICEKIEKLVEWKKIAQRKIKI